jgi:hypothetical protein
VLAIVSEDSKRPFLLAVAVTNRKLPLSGVTELPNRDVRLRSEYETILHPPRLLQYSLLKHPQTGRA